MRGQPFERRDQVDIIGHHFETFPIETDQTVGTEKVVTCQPTGKTSGSPSRQDMGGSGGVIAHRNRCVVPKEYGTGVGNFGGELFSIVCGNMQMFRRDEIGDATCFVSILGKNNRAELFQRKASRITTFDFIKPRFLLRKNFAQFRFIPANQDARTGCVFGLR